jgi:hypothetical protein
VFDWLFEGRTTVYVALAALAAFFLLIWWQNRKRGWLICVGIAFGLVGLYALLDRIVETDREQLVRKIQEMAAAVNAQNVEALMEHISDNFRSPRGKDKQQLRTDVENYRKMIGNVHVWDIIFVDTPSREHPPAKVFFSAKTESGDRPLLADCEATFDFDAQHGWRLQSIRLLKPQTTEEWQIQL